MKRYLTVAIALITCLSSQFTFAQDKCDNPDDPELTRIYYGNEMFNNDRSISESAIELQKLISFSPDYDYGIARNPSEPVLLQLINVFKDKVYDFSYFWKWLDNLEDADAWFQEAYINAVAQYTESSIDDTYLFIQINQYERDLQSGKKVVIVSHSQGNFYANNAYNYIVSRNSDYQNSIGIVGVASPASYLAGANLYATHTGDYYYTTNASDLLMSGVRTFFPGTLPPNPGTTFDGPDDFLNHNFVNTYVKGFGGRIKQQVLQTISRLQVPNKNFECKNPAEVPVDVDTTPASNITKTSARLNGLVVSGKQIGALCIRGTSPSVDPATCEDLRDNISQTGIFNAGMTFGCTVNGLTPGANYRFRVCGREGDRISDGGIQSFTTEADVQQCDSTYPYTGGSNGLNVDYTMGTTGAFANIEFTTYTIPDKLEIWHGGTLIYTTGNYIPTGSNPMTARICHEPSRGSIWNVKVYGNPDTGTAWRLKVSCPQNTSVFDLCPTM